MTITIPDYISTRLQVEADALRKTSEERVVEILHREIAPENNFDKDYINKGLENIKNLLAKIPCVPFVATSKIGESFWWLKFRINIKSKIAWTVVQELGYILNYLALNEKLLDSFYPVSPPPYLDGGPEEFLSWIIESSIPFVDTNIIFDYLDGRLPADYGKEESWQPED